MALGAEAFSLSSPCCEPGSLPPDCRSGRFGQGHRLGLAELADRHLDARAGKDAFVRVDGVDYSVPPAFVGRRVAVRVARLVDDTVARGARIVCDGRPIHGKGYFVEPTVLTGIRPGSGLLDDEIFGPVAPIIPFGDLGEAIAAERDPVRPLGIRLHKRPREGARRLRGARGRGDRA